LNCGASFVSCASMVSAMDKNGVNGATEQDGGQASLVLLTADRLRLALERCI
jgi:hypothetical protein